MKVYEKIIKILQAHSILIPITLLGGFLRLYRLNTEYVWFNDTFFRLLPSLEIAKGLSPNYDPMMTGVTYFFVPYFYFFKGLFGVQLIVTILGILIIPLSYYLILKLNDTKLAASFFSFFVSINPTFIALSKVLIWDILILLFFIVSFIVLIKLSNEKNNLYSIIISFLLFFLFTLKAPNILFAPIYYIFLFYKRKFKIKESNDILFSVMVFILLMALHFFYFPEVFTKFIEVGGENFFVITKYVETIKSSIIVLLFPFNSPPSSMYFARQFNFNLLDIPLLLFFVTLLFYLKSNFKEKNILIISIILTFTFFYINFSGWSHRYLVVPIYLMLLLLTKSILSIPKKYKNLVILGIIIGISISFYSTYEMVSNWNRANSYIENNIVTRNSSFEDIEKMAYESNVDLIVSTYGKVFIFNKISKGGDIGVIDFRSITTEELIQVINQNLVENKKIWYVEGWPDNYVFCGRPTSEYKNAIFEMFLLKEIYRGKDTYMDNEGNEKSSFIVHEIIKNKK
jgi:4-amino-4-deoxy-L-arabinose transferase-like glycosyltransferase